MLRFVRCLCEELKAPPCDKWSSVEIKTQRRELEESAFNEALLFFVRWFCDFVHQSDSRRRILSRGSCPSYHLLAFSSTLAANVLILTQFK